ncbi:MICOS complex subunit MIC10 [Dermatophagoides farinae]|uniref:MICOS complex subunit MIC10 n=1 Tax=Dermatophagoides farinae TaxID=6954 RepID=A0A922HUL6_DERFA|nr:MICOS complex subunit mic10-like [Dermatophagoides farinae]KAH7643027.1 micos complex subunit mic10-like [Dermatophagoides farinae]KAH9505858.1 Mitochondrial inner membrane organizing system component [Dermatophagoides farinae]
MSVTNQNVKSDMAICQKYDRFIANAIMNTGIGIAAGSLASLILFKRRVWPIHYGIGIAFGYSLKDFEICLNQRK